MRKTILLFALALTACGSDAPPAVAEGEEHVACALAAAKDFAPDCAVERSQQDGVLFLVVRHPDGGFRRFEVVKDGRGLAVADGSETAQVAMVGGLLEVTVGDDRYRFPATAKGAAKAN